MNLFTAIGALFACNLASASSKPFVAQLDRFFDGQHLPSYDDAAPDAGPNAENPLHRGQRWVPTSVAASYIQTVAEPSAATTSAAYSGNLAGHLLVPPRTMLRYLAAGALVAASGGEAAVSFVSIGDWGGAGINGGGDYHKTSELAVAKQMGETAAKVDAKFVINTGDNFYYCGTQNITDEQFKIDFEDVFTAKSLSVPWYGVLGNHDYAYDVKSQFDYKSPVNDRWQLPTFYYTKRLLLSGSQYATFVFIDTNPCIASYRADDPAGWDPCSGQYGECQDAQGKCHFHEHILAQDCSAQLAWFKKTLAAINKDDWVMVVGHHEADYIDVEDFTAVMLSNGVRLYLNGHTHAMKHYQVDDRKDIDFVTTGAGCMVHTHDQDVCLSSACRNAEERKHESHELFYQKISAFSVHTFAEDFSSLKTDFVDADGNVVHSFTTAKKGGSPSPSPSPPPPSPHGDASCQKLGCGSWGKDHACQCNHACKFHGDCCDDYDQVCGGSQPELVI